MSSKSILAALVDVLALSVLAMPTVGDLKVTAIPPWGLAFDYTVEGATAEDAAFPLVVTATAGEKSYSARNLVGATNCVNGAHRVYWNMAVDGLTATAANSTVTVMYGGQPLYCVIDLAGGVDAAAYPVTYLADEPAGGWTVEHKTTKLVLRRIEAGSFIMGDDQSDESHRVTLTKPFYMSVFAVTQKQWELVAGTTPSYFTGAMRPVETVSYNDIRGETLGAQWPASDAVDATSFFGRLRAKTGLAFDLPTEAQWEYTCRAGTTTTYYWGNSMNGAYAWYSGNASRQTHEVGTRLPNVWGLYDMSGNTWEWCRDWYAPLAYGTDPTGPAAPSLGDGRVRRGGCWDADSSYSTSARRGSFDPSKRKNRTGDFCFRVAVAEWRAQATGVNWSSVADGSGISATTLTLGLAPTAGAAARAFSDGAEVARAMTAQTVDVSLSEGRHVLTHDDGEVALTATFVVASHEIAIDDGTGGAVVANVTARPRYPWNGKVDVSIEIGDGLAAHWPFDGSMRDVSGNGHNLSVGLGQPVLTEGRGGLPDTAYYFDGDSYLHLGEESVFAVSNNFSIALWFKTSVAMSSYGSSKTFWNPGNDVIFAEFNDYKAVGVGVRVGTDGVAVVEHGGFYRPTVLAYKPQGGMPDGWHHVVVTVKDNGGEVLYVDGQYVGTAEINSESLTEKHGNGTKAFWFNDEQSGVGGGKWGHYTGSVDDVRVYVRALSGEEVAMLYGDVLTVTPCIVSLVAKDLVGGTNLPMRTVWKADGTAANPAGESVMPGTHRWVWDADADLPDGFRCDRVAVEVKSE